MTGKLITEPRLADPDGLYATLIAAYRDLDEGASQRFNAKLILLLANHIGDADVVDEAIAVARDAAP
jgi:hypothetical protein